MNENETVIPTHDQIVSQFDAVRQRILRLNLCLDATIDDYPIGRRERGKCRLQVERAPGKGYRTVRTTTNKFGRWCAPKKSTYQGDDVIVVADKVDEAHQCAWLYCANGRYAYCKDHVYLRFANGSSEVLARCWRSGEPTRERRVERVQWRTTTLGITGGGLTPENTRDEIKEYVYEADSPEDVAAWDVWVAQLAEARRLLLDVWSACCVHA